MNIAYYSHYFTPEIGAPSARIYDLSSQWIKNGHDVQVITCFPNHPSGEIYPGYSSQLYKSENLDGIKVHRQWTYVTPNKGFIKKSLGHLSFWPSARFITDSYVNKPDVVVGTSPTFFAAMGAAGIARRRKIPFIMEVRDLWPAIFVDLGIIKNKSVIRLLEKWELDLYANATSIVTVTEAFRQNLIERGIPKHKVFMIPNGADVNYWNPVPIDKDLRKSLNIDKNAFVVLYIGAHGISHALSSILESAKTLENFNDIVFVFVGDGAEKTKLVERSKKLNLGNVRFIDPVEKEKVKEYYAMADICLVPLRNIPLFDTFIPSKMFEMMAMGKPIVASVRGEAADILIASGGANVVRPEDSAAVSKSILSLRENPILRKSLGAAGREYVVNNYSRQQLSAKYALILEESIKRYKETKQ